LKNTAQKYLYFPTTTSKPNDFKTIAVTLTLIHKKTVVGYPTTIRQLQQKESLANAKVSGRHIIVEECLAISTLSIHRRKVLSVRYNSITDSAGLSLFI